MLEVLQDLRARREKMPVAPLAADWKYRTRKFLQRNSLLVAISAAAFVALVAAGTRLIVERASLRRQLATSFLARSQLEFLKGNPLRAISYGAHSNMISSSHLARTSTLYYLSETDSPRLVYPGEGPGVYSADGRLVAASDPAFGAEIRDVASARKVCGPLQTRGDVLVMAFDPHGRKLATGTRDGELRVWDARTCRPLTPPIDQGAAVTSLALSADASVVVAGSADGSVKLWDASSERLIKSAPMRHGNRVTAIMFSPDGTELLTASELDDTARLWSLPGSASLAVIRLAERTHGVAWSPDG
jgi:WD40 repeat protein